MNHLVLVEDKRQVTRQVKFSVLFSLTAVEEGSSICNCRRRKGIYKQIHMEYRSLQWLIWRDRRKHVGNLSKFHIYG
ncbi:hypothetical protein O6P43_019539 [Quillaja saponaria]|uniref:Uncharacterized protein n=1 Tax=Quillaja saponaria TaxID=32244 RepID=A0AAD7PKX9_QUISA|nr:hypothetical protein O6P43_019539 [Quillaja saponaria]